MQISNEGILTQLGYPVDEANLKQLELIEKNTSGFENIKKHIIALNDHLKPYGGYVTLSNTNPYLKIKVDSPSSSYSDIVLAEIRKWADKYNVTLKEVKSQKTYYILGISS